ncbi:response regulator transcription factor [Metabacillus litoralis]|uniref:Response regulator transcription factor n=1 Tax=Metabacillus litoralis TaxID=152268 RepID=A0A5C6VXW5_9BACI|nr:response regulator transcription factor [Metabacillus litoralis]TXC89844.1 response regulator transcription factor [Metabacillus litoralis]
MKSGELCRILIVDDEQLIRQGIKHYLQWEQEGFQIIGEASNGQEALEMVERTNPHIILTDIVMPIMDGEELTRIVKAQYPNIEVIILSSYGEFDYVRSTFQSGAVDYILKPKLDAENLLNVLTTVASRISSLQASKEETNLSLNIGHIIDKFLSGFETEYDAQLIRKAFPVDCFCLLVVDTRSLSFSNNLSDSDSLKKRIKNKIEIMMGDTVFQPYTSEKNVSVFLVNLEEKDLIGCLTLADELLKEDSEVAILITDSFKDFSQIGNKYNSVIKKMLQYRFYFPEAKLLTEKNQPKEVPPVASFNLDKFTNDFKHERFDAAFNYLNDHIKALSGGFTTDIFEFKSFFGNIIFNITILLSNMDYDVEELENAKFTLFNSIDEATSASAVVEQLEQFIEKAKKSILAKGNQSGGSNIKMILEYVEDHYAEPLNLTGVANHFHFNPSYLSSYFTSHNGEGFNEYLNRIRIEEAAKLLNRESTPISEISGIVGYSDHSYFCKVFKKLKGVSPSQYRRSQKLK